MTDAALILDNGATFSDCKKYRYVLWRTWDENRPKVMFIGLNPSTANDTSDDPTIKRVCQIANYNGFGGVYMVNCFPMVTAYPEQLITDKVVLNLEYIKKYGHKAATVVFAWGNFDEVKRLPFVEGFTKMFPDAKALWINKDGSPKHPLYCRKDSVFINYNSNKK